MVKSRDEVLQEDKWNVEALYPSFEQWEKDFESFQNQKQEDSYWPVLKKFKGTLNTGPRHVKTALDEMMDIDRKLTKLYTYAHLRHDEDIISHSEKMAYEKIVSLAHRFAQESSWFQPELLSLPEDKLRELLESQELKEYAFYLEKLIRLKPHTLSKECEELIALSGEALQTAHKAFSAINDADFKFNPVKNSANDTCPLSHGTYGVYIRDHDRSLRENAFKTYHQTYMDYENTLCELLNGQMRTHVLNAKARHYPSSLAASLFPKNIDVSVYHSLIEAVNDNLPVLHRYLALRKRILKVKELHVYDLYVPLTSSVDIRLTYEEAEDLVIRSAAPLGDEYQSYLRKGLQAHRWVDRYENKSKRSGAYSSGCFDSMPYILMNYKNLLRDVFTLAHEAGHSMHSLYSRSHQPYHYSDYPIFLAEVASTFNEDLLSRLMISECKNADEKIFLINQQIEDIRGTLFRQTMFAEFELKLHEYLEKGIPLTPQHLKEDYHKLNRKYFGPDTIIDSEIDIEWARIPHFYYNFYVFQYSTGISAALSLANRVIEGGHKDREAYLGFLKGGSSQFPIEMLKGAGIDMTSTEPVASAIRKFNGLLNQLEELLG